MRSIKGTSSEGLSSSVTNLTSRVHHYLFPNDCCLLHQLSFPILCLGSIVYV